MDANKFTEFLESLCDVANEKDYFEQTKLLSEFDLSIVAQPYKVNDFVTPKEKMNIKGAGKPHKVIMSWPQVQLHISEINKALSCYNMLVAESTPTGVKLFAAISTEYEPYTGVTYEEYPDVDNMPSVDEL